VTVKQPLAVEYLADTGEPADVTFWTGGYAYARYLRVEMPAQALGAAVADPAQRPSDPLSLQQGKVAVWQRVGTMARANLMAEQKQNGIKVILETDDDYTAMHREHSWVEHLTPNFPPEQDCVELHRMVAGYCDRVIVTTPYLQRIYRQFNDDVVVVPNAVNPSDWPAMPARDESDPLVFAWIGSGDHYAERAMAARAFERLEERAADGKVRCVWMGVEPFGTFRHFIDHVPWIDNWHEWRQAAVDLRIDVGIAPLNQDALNRGRSDLKAIEYAWLGALPLVQKHLAYDTVQADIAMKVGTYEWPEKVEWCARHPEDVRMRAQIAQQTVIDERTIIQTAKQWRDAVTFV